MNITPQSSRLVVAPPLPLARSTGADPQAKNQSPSTEQTAPGSSIDSASADSGSPAATARGGAELSPQQQILQQQQIAQLASRDREVRSHEQAHAAVGGNYAGAPTYSFTRGPDGQAYAVGGEVSIDVSSVPNDPVATLRKMERVQQAALAPAEPSSQDLRVAAQAQTTAAQARVELAALQREEVAAAAAERKAQAVAREEKQAEQDVSTKPEAARQGFDLAPNLQIYQRLSQSQEAPPLVDLIA